MHLRTYQRRTRGVDTNMEETFSMQEVKEYFASEKEWKLASRIFWERNSLRRDLDYFLNAYNIPYAEFERLMAQYRKFMFHEYSSNK